MCKAAAAATRYWFKSLLVHDALATAWLPLTPQCNGCDVQSDGNWTHLSMA
jgi:hypothetical protein